MPSGYPDSIFSRRRMWSTRCALGDARSRQLAADGAALPGVTPDDVDHGGDAEENADDGGKPIVRAYLRLVAALVPLENAASTLRYA
jgi:hypothetical protein